LILFDILLGQFFNSEEALFAVKILKEYDLVKCKESEN
jgi:hypothetical protein